MMDAFVATHVKIKDWEPVADLYEKKWFGYRFLTPGTCLYLFADRYRYAFTGVRGRTKSHSTFGKQEMITLVSQAEITGLWTAMGVADSLGVPYDFYCKQAMEIADRRGKTLPNPRQMYPDWLAVEINDRWERHTTETLVTTGDVHYALRKYEKHPWQDAYQDWLLDQIQTRTNPKYALARVCFEQPQVLPSRAAKIFGVDTLRDAKEIAMAEL